MISVHRNSSPRMQMASSVHQKQNFRSGKQLVSFWKRIRYRYSHFRFVKSGRTHLKIDFQIRIEGKGCSHRDILLKRWRQFRPLTSNTLSFRIKGWSKLNDTFHLLQVTSHAIAWLSPMKKNRNYSFDNSFTFWLL